MPLWCYDVLIGVAHGAQVIADGGLGGALLVVLLVCLLRFLVWDIPKALLWDLPCKLLDAWAEGWLRFRTPPRPPDRWP